MNLPSKNVIPVKFHREMEQRFLDYALSVIIARALPNVADGLKPVHRRILYAMHQLKLTADKPYKKSARIVGEVIGKYHPHGDLAVYNTMVKMIQKFASHYPLIAGHGNFGSIDGDAPAAMRYTEVRLAKITQTLLTDLQYATVDFTPNYDGTEQEPVALPGILPNLLINGSTGIAVGMATSIPPHNLGELADALIAYLQNPALNVAQLSQYLYGPDFPTGCEIVLNSQRLTKLFTTGKGQIPMRARCKLESFNKRQQIVVHEIPYQVNKSDLIHEIVELVKARKITEITDLKDESNRLGIRLILRLKKDVQIDVLFNKLFRHTRLRDNFSVNLLALHNNRPQVMGYLEVFRYYVEHQLQVLQRRTRFLLQQTQKRLQMLIALARALQQIDQVVATIKQASSTSIALVALRKLLQITENQAKAVLDMKLQRLTTMEQTKLMHEKRTAEKAIIDYQKLLDSETAQKAVLIQKLRQLKNQFPQPRKSKIISHDRYANLKESDLIPHADVLICVTANNYLKRVNLNLFRAQKRGGVGIRGITLNENDTVKQVLLVDTHDRILFFTDLGRVYSLPAWKIPDLGRTAKGTPAQNLIRLKPDEKIRSLMKVIVHPQATYLFVTVKGLVKKTVTEHYNIVKRNGKIAIKLNPRDNLAYVFAVLPQANVIISKNDNLVVRFLVNQVRSTGRATKGLIGVRTDPEKMAKMRVNGASFALPNQKILSVDSLGYGKMTALSHYRLTNRGARGVLGVKRGKPLFSRSICTVLAVKGDEDLLITKSNGKLIISSLKETRTTQSRLARGVRLVKLEPGEKITAVTILPPVSQTPTKATK